MWFIRSCSKQTSRMPIPEPRPYQIQAVEQGVRRGSLLLAMTMGSGKTRVAIDTVESLWCEAKIAGGAVFVLNSTKYQWEREIRLWAPGASVQVIDGDRKMRYRLYKQAHRYRYTILNYDLLIHDWNMIADCLPIDFVIIDECFVAGTLVDTPTGPVPIERIKVGDWVNNVAGVDEVTAIRQVYKQQVVVVTCEDGRSFTCSLEHPILTSSGWTPAMMIRDGDILIDRDQAMCLVFEGVDSTADQAGQSFLREVLLSEVEDCLPACRSTADLSWPVPPWNRADFAGRTFVDLARFRMGMESHGADWWGFRDAAELQSRYWATRSEDRGGSGWLIPSSRSEESPGQEEGTVPAGARVVSVQILQHGDSAWRWGDSRSVACYDLTVKAHPSYSVEGLLVHNCTAIKSFRAKRSQMIKELGGASDYRFALSGQPVENKPEELFSIMEFVDPKILGPFYKFDRTFIKRDTWGKPIKYVNLPVLRKSLTEAMFRRTRKDIEKFLPRMVTIETPVGLDAWSQQMYDSIVADLLDVIEQAVAAGMGGFDLMAHYGRADDTADNRFKGEIMSRVTALRMLCDHPQLLGKSAKDFDDPDSQQGSQYAASILAGVKIPEHSDKLTALMDHVKEVLAEDPLHKVVIFSGFKAMLSMISAELNKMKVGHTLISGDVKSKERDDRIVKFNSDYSCRVFLSSDAGAYGVNLNAGSHLISYDLPWSAGGFAQRMARIDRISSIHQSIFVNSMYCRSTIEARQLEMLTQKQAIGAAFLDGAYDLQGTLSLGLSSLKEFLTVA